MSLSVGIINHLFSFFVFWVKQLSFACESMASFSSGIGNHARDSQV